MKDYFHSQKMISDGEIFGILMERFSIANFRMNKRKEFINMKSGFTSDLTTEHITFDGFVIYDVDVGSTGYQGGDSGHGGKTYIRIKESGGSVAINKIGTDYEDAGFEIALSGDNELAGMIKSLRFVLNALEQKVSQTKDNNLMECSDFGII